MPNYYTSTNGDAIATVMRTSITGADAWWAAVAAGVADSVDTTVATNLYIGISATDDGKGTGFAAINRGYLTFDTSAIPDSATITFVYLYLYKDSGEVFNLIVAQGNQPDSGLTVSDWEAWSILQGQTTTPQSSGWMAISLNGSVVNKAGFSKVVLLHVADFSSTWYNISQHITVHSAGNLNVPYLSITYTESSGTTATAVFVAHMREQGMI